jgi:hypothetical protein
VATRLLTHLPPKTGSESKGSYEHRFFVQLYSFTGSTRGYAASPVPNGGYPGQYVATGGYDHPPYAQPGQSFPSPTSRSGIDSFRNPLAGPPHFPPSHVQHYGPQIQDPNSGQQQQPYFQYSQCNGRKKALCVSSRCNDSLRSCHLNRPTTRSESTTSGSPPSFMDVLTTPAPFRVF